MQIATVRSTELTESMVASDHITQRVAVPAEALTEREQDTLLVLAAANEKVAKVPAPTPGSRAWSLGGNVD